jgi:hypothetical protein
LKKKKNGSLPVGPSLNPPGRSSLANEKSIPLPGSKFPFWALFRKAVRKRTGTLKIGNNQIYSIDKYSYSSNSDF